METLPRSVLYRLAAESTPEPIREEIVQRAEDGEHFTHAQVKKMVDKAVADARAEQPAGVDAEQLRQQAEQEAASKFEKKLAVATEKYNAEVERLRSDLASALAPDELQSAIDEALSPLQDKIKRLQAELDKRKKEPPTRKDEFGLRAQAITGALRVLATSLTITPPQMIEASKFVSEVTGRPLGTVMADDVINARNVSAWLAAFLEGADQ